MIWQQQIARHFPERFKLPEEIHTALSLLGAVGIWLWLSRWVGSGFYLTATWAVLAFVYVGTGLWIRERTIRLALVMLAFVRIGVFDVWNIQDQVARMFSVMALGGVLLAIGYIYNRHRESIRKGCRLKGPAEHLYSAVLVQRSFRRHINQTVRFRQ